MSRWFRFYDDALNDPKVQTLSPDLFKLWVNLLCVASKNGGQLPVIYQLTYLLRRRSDRLERDFNELVSLGLIDLVGDHFEPHNWLKFQYKSDTSADRTRAWRERNRDVTPAVTVTPPDNRVQNTETEKKKERTGKTILPGSWLPSPVHFQLAEQLGLPSQSVEDAAAEMRDWSVGNGEKRSNWDSVFSNWLRRNGQRRSKNGKAGIIEAADSLIDRIQGWGAPGAIEIGGGSDAAAVRMLPKG